MHFSWIECFVKICLVWSGFVELCKYQFHKLKRFVSQVVFTAAVCSVFNHLSIFCFILTHKYLFSLLFFKEKHYAIADQNVSLLYAMRVWKKWEWKIQKCRLNKKNCWTLWTQLLKHVPTFLPQQKATAHHLCTQL